MAKIIKSYHIGGLTISETTRPDTITLKINTANIDLSKEEFRLLCGLSYTADFVSPPAAEETAHESF